MSENVVFSQRAKIFLTSFVVATTLFWTLRSVLSKQRL